MNGLNTAAGARGLGVEEAAVLEVGIGVATRTRGAGGGQDEVAPGENGRMTPHAADFLA